VRFFLLCFGLATGTSAGAVTVGEVPNCDLLSCNRLSYPGEFWTVGGLAWASVDAQHTIASASPVIQQRFIAHLLAL
jgi:hypothetical protein